MVFQTPNYDCRNRERKRVGRGVCGQIAVPPDPLQIFLDFCPK